MEKNIGVFTTELDNRFVDKHGTEGVIDFPSWLSYFTFDVISDLTWSKPYGFILRGEDILGMIGWVSNFLQYGFVVSFFMVSLRPICHRALRLTPTGGPNALVGSTPQAQPSSNVAREAGVVQRQHFPWLPFCN